MSRLKIKNPNRMKSIKEPSALSQTIKGLIDKVSDQRQNKSKNENIIIGSLYKDEIINDSTSYNDLKRIGLENGFTSVGRFRAAIGRWQALRKQEEIIRKKIEAMVAAQKGTTDDSNTQQSGEALDTPTE